MGLITYENLEDGQKVTANVFNERFAQIVAQLNGNLDESNFANEGISKEKLKAEVYESIYPIGSMYVNFTDNTNPATLLGFGTWTAVTGRVVVGYDAAQTEFNAAEKTGGAKTHTLTIAEIPAHSHNLNAKAGSGGGGTYGLLDRMGDSVNTLTSVSQGGGEAHNNLQPYIVGYVWKRIS